MSNNSIRRISLLPQDRRVFLTFDDGPDPEQTPRILDLLAKHNAKATFFVIAHKAAKNPRIIRRILCEGHAIGNHSLDHQTRNYFRGPSTLKSWISRAEDVISSVTGCSTIGFRPPVGIVTPPLREVVSELKMAMYLWNKRYFDRTLPFVGARSAGEKLSPGDIILLHDVQRSFYQKTFVNKLDEYLNAAKNQRLDFAPLAASLAIS